LIGVAVPLWAKAAGGFPKESESTVVQIVGQQFNWNARYPAKTAVSANRTCVLSQQRTLRH